MLIDTHANPGDMDPKSFAEAVAGAGLSAVVVTRTNRADGLKAYADALESAGVAAFAGVELALDRGLIVYIPRTVNDEFTDGDWTNQGSLWSVEALNDRLAEADGALIAAHPYFRGEHPGLGDRVYRIKGLTALATRVGRGSQGWDRLAEQAALKRSLTQLGSSGGDQSHLGAAATVIANGIDSQSELVEALENGPAMVIEMDDPENPRDRRPPARPSSDDGRGRRDDGPRGRRDGRDDRGRGRGRGDDRRGGRDRGGRGHRN